MKLSSLSDTFRRVKPTPACGAVIVAAGTASRMGGIDKIMADLGGRPVIRRTLQPFLDCPGIREIVIVTRPDLLGPITELCREYDKVRAVIEGGASRQESVKLGLAALSEKTKLVAVQDGARPLVTWQVIDRTVRAAHSYGAAAPAIPVKDTIKTVQGGIVINTPDRSRLQAVQTPQVFDLDLLKGALARAEKNGDQVTDDCSAVELMGMSVRIVEGDERNMKVTTPLDLKIAELLLEENK